MSEESQFDEPMANVCTACEKEVRDTYFLANGHMICPECRLDLLESAPSGSALGRLTKAIGFGLLGGAIGAAVYFGIVTLTGYELALVSILVGFLVGAGVKLGCGGRGGWGYQILAVGMTYLAIVSSYVPLIIDEMNSQMLLDGQALSEVSAVPKVTILASGSVLFNGAEVSTDQLRGQLLEVSETAAAVWYYREGIDDGEPPPVADEVAGAIEDLGFERLVFKDAAFTEPMLIGDGLVNSDPASVLGMFAILLLIAAASPFFSVSENLIGLAIIGVALYQAWSMNKKESLEIEGPLELGGSMQPVLQAKLA